MVEYLELKVLGLLVPGCTHLGAFCALPRRNRYPTFCCQMVDAFWTGAIVDGHVRAQNVWRTNGTGLAIDCRGKFIFFKNWPRMIINFAFGAMTR